MTVISTQPPQLSDSEVQEIIQNIYGIEAAVLTLDSERDQNFHLRGDDGNEYVLKISNYSLCQIMKVLIHRFKIV